MWEGKHEDVTMAFGFNLPADRARFEFTEEGALVRWSMSRKAAWDGRLSTYEASGYVSHISEGRVVLKGLYTMGPLSAAPQGSGGLVGRSVTYDLMVCPLTRSDQIGERSEPRKGRSALILVRWWAVCRAGKLSTRPPGAASSTRSPTQTVRVLALVDVIGTR